MKIRITESQFNQLFKENVDDILDKISRGEELKPSEKRKLEKYSKHLQSGGKDRDFEYSDQPDEDEYSGKSFKYTINKKPITFKFSERQPSPEGGVEYYGEIFYDGNEYIGGLFTDENGFLLDYDFYDSLELGGERLQDLLKDFKYELQHFFQEEVIPELNK